ncbi:hypothetical protein NSA48_06890 [Frisingicoccus caecimuris]|uniref:Uncharacterized protein n=1 Tax=Frisingicoccus caecimuris TaxID=1796636 RepID=A0A4R2LD70_9FIRM|nr:hypothetical protein [Frisingicoccus caecimuris]MCR1918757.1 hypothetical protein [Frisingicoccus caecimuris]TCO86389.1 hypothetical protein EV212_101174 [Frisingicoccus caecimuris]
MDKNILVQYSAMKEEIKDIRRRIEKDRKELDRLNKLVVSDSVTCGKKGKKPIRTVKIQGRPVAAISRKESALKKHIYQLEQKEAELMELTIQAEEYINSIDKSELRMMFRLYFIDNLTYLKVAEKMNYMFPKRKKSYSDENVKKRIQRFFQNVPQCPEKI